MTKVDEEPTVPQVLTEATQAAAAAFQAAGWTWAGGKAPDEGEIRKTIHMLLASLRAAPDREPGYRSETGRLVVEDDGDGDARVLLMLGNLWDALAPGQERES